jgi:hypothetical protein
MRKRMPHDADLKAYVAHHGGAPEKWRLWWDEDTKQYLIVSFATNGEPRAHMIDDEGFAARLAGYLRLHGALALEAPET